MRKTVLITCHSRAAVVLGFILLFAFSALAQHHSKCPMGSCNCAVSGRVADQQDRVIRGASVVLENRADGVKHTASTDASGTFVFAALPKGAYRLEVAASDFAPYVEESVALESGALTRNIRLRLPTVAEIVNVEAKGELYKADLDVSEVRETPAKDVGEALASVEGVWKVRKAGIANDIILRGFGKDNLNVLIDGARMYGACPGRMDPVAHHVDFAEVERVDVIKGAFDVTSAGSLGGVVKIINKTPAMGLHFRPTLSTGSFGFYNPAMTASYGAEKFKVLTGYSYRTSDAYKDGRGKRVTSYGNYMASALDNHAFDIHTGWFSTEFSPAEKQHITLGYTRQSGGLVLYPALMMDSPYDNADRVNFKYQVKELSSTVRAIRVDTYLTQVKHWMTDELRTSAMMAMRAPFSMGSHASTRVAGGTLEADVARDFTFGFEMYHRNWNTLGYMFMGMPMTANTIPDVNTRALGAFGDFHRALTERVRVNAGLRFDRAEMRAESPQVNTGLYYAYNGTRQLSRDNAAPSGNVRLTFSLPKSVELFMGVGSTVRMPDPQERYLNQLRMMSAGSDNVGNPNLDPARNTEFTLGANLRHGSSYFKPVLFYSHLTDYITMHNQMRMNMVPGVMNMKAKSWDNINARIYGGEMSYALACTQNLLLSGGTSYSRGIRDREPSAGILDPDIVEMPPLKTWAALRYVYKTSFAEISGTAVGRQNHVDRDLNETPTAGYGLLNLKTGWHPGKLYLTFMVDNLLNRYYVEHFSYTRDPYRLGIKVPEPGRNVFAQVSYTF